MIAIQRNTWARKEGRRERRNGGREEKKEKGRRDTYLELRMTQTGASSKLKTGSRGKPSPKASFYNLIARREA